MKRSLYEISMHALIGLFFSATIMVVSAWISGTEVLAAPQTVSPPANVKQTSSTAAEPLKQSNSAQAAVARSNPLRKETRGPVPQFQPQNPKIQQAVAKTLAKPSGQISLASHTAPVEALGSENPNFDEMGDFGQLDSTRSFEDFGSFHDELPPIEQTLTELDDQQTAQQQEANFSQSISISQTNEMTEPRSRQAPPLTTTQAANSGPSGSPVKKVTRPITARNTTTNTSAEARNQVTQVDHTKEVVSSASSAETIHPPNEFAHVDDTDLHSLSQSDSPSQWNESQENPRVGSLERPSFHQPNVSPSLQFSTQQQLTPQLSNVQPPVSSSVSQPVFATDISDFHGEIQEENHEIFHNSGFEEPEGIGTPGESTLYGVQAPLLELEKVAPKEVQINQPTILKTVIRNKGLTTAKDIILQDKIPRGTRLLSTHPALANGTGGDLYWSLGSLAPQEEIVVEMRVVPLVEGAFGSVATVHFASEVSAVSAATQAMLQLEISSKPTVLVGNKVTYNLTLSNPGTGTATGVVLELDVPEGLEHPQGKRIQSPVGELKAKETKQFPLTLLCTAAGTILTEVHAHGDNNLESIASNSVEVLAPELQLQIAGPRQRFLDRKAAYTLTVKNPGTASANGVDLTVKLPHGIKFESTNQKGVYNDKAHSVHWMIQELPARDSGEIELVVVPNREGDHVIRFEGTGEKNLKAETKHDVSVQGIPSIGFNVTCLTNPIEVGRTANYEVKLYNRGTKAAGNVVVNVRLSEGMQYASADGATRHRTHSGVIQFEPIGSLESKQEKIYRFSAKCLEIGDHRISVSVSSDELKAPVTKEESTLVYGDQ